MNFKQKRDAYAYPMVGLSGTVASYHEVAFDTSSKLEAHHARLLCSAEDDEVLLGYLSTLFWGHYAGAAGRTTANRALSRVQLALVGSSFERNGKTCQRPGINHFGRGKAVALIRKAKRLLDERQYGEGVKLLCDLPQLGFAFASKVAAFLAPETCGVIDSVIAEKHPHYGFKLRAGYVSDVKENVARYQAYCQALCSEADKQNQLGKSAYWQERNGELRAWRAVDIERALYSL
ncbi:MULTISPECIES: hypothetical protein [unclassified Pseudomonas]|uniref:hypothetical protein n=1 Tax=unclassified Pseudomonas TaxID=196821 RepID=UPI0037F7E5AB